MTGPAEPPDPIGLAILALKAEAAKGNIKAIRALTDGTLGRLEALRSGAAEDGGRAVRGEARTNCPNCQHRLLIHYDHQAHHAALAVIDLTTGLATDPAIRKNQITRTREATR
jgi:hypothetical protein